MLPHGTRPLISRFPTGDGIWPDGGPVRYVAPMEAIFLGFRAVSAPHSPYKTRQLRGIIEPVTLRTWPVILVARRHSQKPLSAA